MDALKASGLMAAALALAACATTPTAESTCLARGGRMVAYTMFRHVCEWPAPDAGRTCQDSRECAGLCMLREDAYVTEPTQPGEHGVIVQPVRKLIPSDGSPVSGQCSAVQRDIKAPNCTAHVSDGKVALADCID
jgi:hypothetical protein